MSGCRFDLQHTASAMGHQTWHRCCIIVCVFGGEGLCTRQTQLIGAERGVVCVCVCVRMRVQVCVKMGLSFEFPRQGSQGFLGYFTINTNLAAISI